MKNRCFTPFDFDGEVTTNSKRYKVDFISLSFLYHFLQPIIPVFSKLADHWLAEELPQRDAVAFAFALGGHADAPFVVKDVGEAVFFDQSDGVEVAGYWLPKVTFAFEVGLFDGAECRAVLVEIDKSAFLAVHQRSDQFACLVVVVDVVFFHDLDAFGAHVGFDGFKVVFNLLYLIGFERRTGIAGHTAPALAFRQAAAELGVQKFVSDDDII